MAYKNFYEAVGFFGCNKSRNGQCHGCKCMRTWHEFFRYQIHPDEQYVCMAPYEKELRDIVARFHVKIYLRAEGQMELWNRDDTMRYVGDRPNTVWVCNAQIPPNAEIALQYNQSSRYYGTYALGCDGYCTTARKQMRWRIYTELRRMNPSFQMAEYTERELFCEFLKQHTAQTACALCVVWSRTQGSLFSTMPHDLFRWFVKKYLCAPMKAFCYTGPRMPTRDEYLLTTARYTNAMLVADGSALLKYQN